jgi:hypothetical protein
MKIRVKRIVLLVLAVTLLAVSAQAQSDESRIRDLRAGLKAMTDNPPPADAPDAPDYQRRVGDILVQLQRLLLKKTGSLETRINGLQDAARTVVQVQEQVAQLTNELRGVEREIREIDRTLARSGGPRAAVPQPPGTDPEEVQDDSGVTRLSKEEIEAIRAKLTRERELQTEEARRREREAESANEVRQAFTRKVMDVSTEALEEAAVPPELNSPPPSCNGDGFPVNRPYSRLELALCSAARDVVGGNSTFDLENSQGNILTILIAKLLKTKENGESYSSFVTDSQDNRVDQQIGAGPTSNSSTSLVSKGGIPYLFAFAVENGAVEQFQKDTELTFRFNPAGVINMFANNGFITGLQGTENDPVLKFLRKTSIGLTFDTSRGDTPGTFTGNRQQLSQVQARVEFVNERDPRHKKYMVDWEKLVADEGVKLAEAIATVTEHTTDYNDPRSGQRDIAFKDPPLQAWLLKTQEKVAAVDTDLVGVERINAIAKVISEEADQLPIDLVSKETVDAITAFAEKSKTYIDKKNELFDKIAKGKIYTLDYSNRREVNAPDTSTFNFIAATGTGNRIGLTVNGSFTFFHQRPAALSLTSPRPGRFRDFQFAGQIDIPFTVGETQFDFWFSGRYERLLEDATTFAGTAIPGTKGDIAFGQFGLNIPIPGLGIKFPVSFTFANRTELVKEKEIRGNFGFTFNWDTLFSKLKPF